MSTTTAKREGERATEAAGTAVDKAKEAAGHAGEAISGAASAVGQKVGEVASAVGQRAGEVAASATSSVGSGMQSLGETVREKGPESGMLGRATESVAGALEEGGKYLEEKNFSDMAEDITNLIRRNPLPALLVGVGVGFLLAKALRS